MTAALITGAGGLAVGLSLLWWALVERKTRFEAEKDFLRADARLNDLRTKLSVAATSAQMRRENERALKKTIEMQRTAIAEAQERLVKGGSPEAIGQWLDDQFKEQA